MKESLDSASEIAARAIGNVTRSSERLVHLVSFVPDDKLAWKPSPTAKSALGVTAHCALTSRFFADVIAERLPESLPSPEEFFKNLHEAGEKITTRDEALALVKETTAELSCAIAAVNAENIDATPRSPFGPLPVSFWMQQGGDHLAGHVGQLEYLQTIWGDLDNHFG
jgi:hypothetical protein